MNLKKLLPVALIGALALGTVAPHAQNTPQKLAYVDVTTVQKAHPKWKDVEALQKEMEKALKPARDEIQAIQAKGANATAADRQKLQQLATTFQANLKQWEEKIGKVTDPIFDDVNTAVSKAAKAQNVTLVLGREVAASSQLVIYADPSLDLTKVVVAELKK